MHFSLIPHPDTPCPEVAGIGVSMACDGDLIALEWQVDGDIAALAIPAPASPARTDGLWQHLCVELFVRDEEGPGYTEYNFAPSGAWAAYQFDDYRTGMRELEMTDAPEIERSESAHALFVKIELMGFYSPLPTPSLRAERGNPENLPRRGLLRRYTPRNDDSQIPRSDHQPIALSAVIETRDGAKSYWALAHPPGKPDFHHADCFIGQLAASKRP
jgi:hypothetical protein